MDNPKIKLLRARSKLEWEALQKYKKYWSKKRLRNHRGITNTRRTYKSVDWIEVIINSEFPAKSKSIDARIQKNLIKKQKLLDVKRCLITDALIYHESMNLCCEHRIGKIKMMSKKGKVYKPVDRAPILVKADIPLIASRLDVSEILVKKYLAGMDKSRFTQMPGNIKRHSSTLGGYRIIGGYIFKRNRPKFDEDEEDLPPIIQPVYFWSFSQPDIREKLAEFSLKTR